MSGVVDVGAVGDILRAKWCELLGTPDVTNGDDFFSLGGTSILAISFVDHVESTLGIEFPIDALFLDGTFGTVLAACVEVLPAAGTG